MSAPLTAELFSVAFKRLIFKKYVPSALPCVNGIQLNHEATFSSFVGSKDNNASFKWLNTDLQTPFLAAQLYMYNSSREYGHKRPQKPPKVTFFQYSGDLRKIPEIDPTKLVYTYQGLEKEIGQNEAIQKLSSLEYATGDEKANHKRELVIDRIVQLFGPNSEIEQEIALLTLGIRQMIPYCILQRQDKGNKIFLLKRIFRRRRLLTRLRELDHERFEWLLRELKIRYVLPRDREEYKGWKYNLRMSTQNEAVAKQREKLVKLKEKFEAEKNKFFEKKAQVLSEIQNDLEKFGLSRDFLDQLQVVEKQEPVKEVKIKVEKEEPVKASKKKR
ncbi:28S ribosomal protein S15 mitochondrial [Biomphalaria glabrata]|nr:28S ribosomal protein S15; mitochondrial-like [Biomphalaria glabrata]